MLGIGPIKRGSLRVGHQHWECRKALWGPDVQMEWRTPALRHLPCYLSVFISYNFSFLTCLLHSNWAGFSLFLSTPHMLLPQGLCTSCFLLLGTYFLRHLSGLAASFSSSLALTWRHALSQWDLPCLELQSLCPLPVHFVPLPCFMCFFFSSISIIWHFIYVHFHVLIVCLTPLEKRLANHST